MASDSVVVPADDGEAPLLFTDMKLIAKGDGTAVKVHRGVLAAHSRIFREVLTSCEEGTALVHYEYPLEHKTKEDLDILLAYLYPRSSRAEKFSISTISRLLEMSREYDMPGAMAEAEKWLIANQEVTSPVTVPDWLASGSAPPSPRVLTAENAAQRFVRFIVLADEYKLTQFYEQCLKTWTANLSFVSFQTMLQHGDGVKLPSNVLLDLITRGFSGKNRATGQGQYCQYCHRYY